MEAKEIEALIRFHQAGLDQYRQHISPAAQYLEEQTIKALGELKGKANQDIATARDILKKRQGKQE